MNYFIRVYLNLLEKFCCCQIYQQWQIWWQLLFAATTFEGWVPHLKEIRAKFLSSLSKAALQIRAVNYCQSTVNYCQSSDFDCPYLSCNDHGDQWLFQKVFFYWYYFYFLEIALNNLELVFLEFKHIYKTQRTSLFSFYLIIFYLLFCNHSVY